MARSTLSSMTVPDVPADPRSGMSGGRSPALSLILSLRPSQWTKNLLVFAPLLFAVKLFDFQSVARATGGFAVFCGLSSVVYLINDVMDREGDRQHPRKRQTLVGLATPPLTTPSAP